MSAPIRLLLALADPEQILGLSAGYSRDAWVAGDVARYPILSGGAEDMLVLKPDVVVASLFDKRSTRELLKAHGLRSRRTSGAADLARGEGPDPRDGQHRRPSRSRRGARSRGSMRHWRGRARLSPQDTFACCRCRGAAGSPGSDSFVGSLLAETGLVNAAGDLGFDFGGFASLEAIVSLKPDFLLVSQAGDFARDDGQAFLLHPALERFYPPEKRIVIPERLTECGGVMLAEALDVLTAELKRVGR